MNSMHFAFLSEMALGRICMGLFVFRLLENAGVIDYTRDLTDYISCTFGVN